MKQLMIAVLGLSLGTATTAQAGPRPAADAPEAAAGGRDKIVCKRFLKTGSLVDGYRTCKTKWEWERERENVRQLSVSDSCNDRANGGAACM
jgi:hypothetical protein